MVNCPGKFTADAAAAKRGFGNPLPGGRSPGKFGNRSDDAAAAAAAAAADALSFGPPLLFTPRRSPIEIGDIPPLLSILFILVEVGDFPCSVGSISWDVEVKEAILGLLPLTEMSCLEDVRDCDFSLISIVKKNLKFAVYEQNLHFPQNSQMI